MRSKCFDCCQLMLLLSIHLQFIVVEWSLVFARKLLEFFDPEVQFEEDCKVVFMFNAN